MNLTNDKFEINNMDMNLYASHAKKYHLHHAEQPFFEKRTAVDCSCLQFSQTISKFYQIQIDHQEQPIFVIPDGCIDIIFECDPIAPQARVFGSTLDMQHVPLRSNIPYFGVRFLPGVMPAFLQVSAEDIFNNSINFSDIVTCPYDLIPEITKNSDIKKQIHLFLNTFSSQLKRDYSVTTNFVIQAIFQGNPDLNIKFLEQKTGYCSRHIQRIFKQDIGISIKAFSCIMRFQSAIQALTAQQQNKLSDLTYDLGYNDQAHFHKEFKKFSNMSPSGFIKYLRNYI